MRASRSQVGPDAGRRVPLGDRARGDGPRTTPSRGDESDEDKGEAAAPADDDSQAERIRRREAEWIARRLRAMFDLRREDRLGWSGERPRAVRPGDIALLFRALTNVEYYEEALRRYGIDYYLVGGHAFYAQQEIYDMVNLLRALANPCDEVSLVGVLRSPMFGLLDETLYWLEPASRTAWRAGCSPSGRRRSWAPSRPGGRAFAAATLAALRA